MLQSHRGLARGRQGFMPRACSIMPYCTIDRISMTL